MSMRLQSFTVTFIPGSFEPSIQLNIVSMDGEPPRGDCTIAQHHIDTLKDVARSLQQSVDSVR